MFKWLKAWRSLPKCVQRLPANLTIESYWNQRITLKEALTIFGNLLKFTLDCVIFLSYLSYSNNFIASIACSALTENFAEST
ncbi:MAG: hypothetical protein J6568_04855 [Snodgrassella sp.]|nr:hypothetical protein [Snodgrassella sp.]